MKRRFPISKVLKRSPPNKDPKFLIVIVCEGEITEPNYLESFAKCHSNGLVDVIPITKGGAPLTLVTKAVEKKKELEKKSRKSKDSYESLFQVWGMFDIDEHPNVAHAKEKARANGVNLAISNPCFELWGVLHFEKHDAPVGRHDIQRKLSQIMTGYQHDESPIFNYQLIKNEYNKARANAVWLENRRQEEGIAGGNPSCDVYKLLDEIIKNGKVNS